MSGDKEVTNKNTGTAKHLLAHVYSKSYRHKEGLLSCGTVLLSSGLRECSLLKKEKKRRGTALPLIRIKIG